jgi:hypothetical protein
MTNNLITFFHFFFKVLIGAAAADFGGTGFIGKK